MSVDVSIKRSEIPSSDEDTSTLTMARTAASKPESHLPGPGDSEDPRKDRARTQTHGLNLKATGLTGMFWTR